MYINMLKYFLEIYISNYSTQIFKLLSFTFLHKKQSLFKIIFFLKYYKYKCKVTLVIFKCLM